MSAEQFTVKYATLPEFPGYRFGDDGSVWSRRSITRAGRLGSISILTKNWHRLRCTVTKRGRIQLTLRPGRKNHFLHTLILRAFVGDRPEGMQCCHEDDNQQNNALSNLRWDTPKSNAADAIRNGKRPRGERINTAKLTTQEVVQLRLDRTHGFTYKELADKYGITKSTVGPIVRRKIWKHI